MSSEPPPRRSDSRGGGRRLSTRAARPLSGEPTRRCTARAIAWSASVHAGSPTRSMLTCIACAMTRLKCCGHAAPMMRVEASRVPVICAAARAMVSAIANISWMCG
jgi:hypothetical protein